MNYHDPKMEKENLRDNIDSDITLVVDSEEHVRIDKYLASLELEALHSRSFIDRLLEDDYITVDDAIVKKSYPVQKGDIIHIRIPVPPDKDIVAENIELKFVYQDEHIAIVDKPAGMVVHPAPGHYEGTLVNAIMYHLKTLSKSDDPLRPGIVHRLDKDTSGLIIVAKNDFVHAKLKNLFHNHEIEKIYIAYTMGNFEPSEGSIRTYYGRNPRNKRKMAVLEDGKLAITHYEVIERYPGFDVTKIYLETGRTHQIRVHFSFFHHPVMGDYYYSNKKQMLNLVPDQTKKLIRHMLRHTLHRQALHAHQLSFIHPITNKMISVTSPIPPDMDNVLNIARKTFYYK